MPFKGSKRRRVNSENAAKQLHPSHKEQVRKLFEKKFTFEQQDQTWKIGDLTDICHEDNTQTKDADKTNEIFLKLSNLKSKLNEVKDRLSDKDIINWHEHTKFMHTSGGVIAELKTALNVELCTQAWCKFYEILGQFPIVPEEHDFQNLNSVHLCEAPGAFITALNHYTYSRAMKDKWDWLATTLSPYYEGNSPNHMIDDDRFIRGTLDRWYFGKDGSGNLMDRDNIAGLVETASKFDGRQLVTADGSIDCQDAPSDQETLVSELHYYETETAMRLLSKGGSFVIKVFTMFEKDSITLMFILNCCFNKVSVIKPATSKPGNSEVYVVCQDFTDETDDALNYIEKYLTGKTDISSSSYPLSFISQHLQCCEQFVNYQIEAIQSNLETYEKMDSNAEILQISKREYCQELFMSKFKIRQIPQYSRIIGHSNHKKYSPFKLEKCFEPVLRSPVKATSPLSYKCSTNNKLSGSFHERREQISLPWNIRLQQMELLEYSNESINLQCQQPLTKEDIESWEIKKEGCPEKIHSSRFCSSKMLSCWNEIVQNKPVSPETTKCKHQTLVKELSDHWLTNDDLSSTITSLYCFNCDNVFINELKTLQTISTHVVTSPEELSALGNGVLFCQIVGEDSGEVSLDTKKRFLTTVKELCKNIRGGSSVILHISTCLTRFTAGLVYILSRCFMKTNLKNITSVNPLHQLLYLQVFTGALDDLDQYLQSALTQLDDLVETNSSWTLGEILPLNILLNDFNFTRFINQANRNVLIKCINSTIQSERNRLCHQKQEKISTEMTHVAEENS